MSNSAFESVNSWIIVSVSLWVTEPLSQWLSSSISLLAAPLAPKFHSVPIARRQTHTHTHTLNSDFAMNRHLLFTPAMRSRVFDQHVKNAAASRLCFLCLFLTSSSSHAASDFSIATVTLVVVVVVVVFFCFFFSSIDVKCFIFRSIVQCLGVFLTSSSSCYLPHHTTCKRPRYTTTLFLSSAHGERKWEGDGRVEGRGGGHNGDIRGVRGQTHISATSLEKLFSRWVFVALPPLSISLLLLLYPSHLLFLLLLLIFLLLHLLSVGK